MIYFGVAGWSYDDWAGMVYPSPKPKGFDPLAYLAGYLDTIEINSTFYRPPASKAAASWARRVAENPRFSFTAKLWRRFTHERAEAWGSADVDVVRAGLAPLMEAGRLGCLLIQFPWSFKREPASREWLGDVIAAFREFPLAVEVRHGSWNVPEFYASLAEHGVGAVNIDQPLFRHSIKPDAQVTAGIGYVRLHGRNYENWFREDAETHERYDYLYTKDELAGWLDRIHEVAERARATYVIANNHFRGQAVVNIAMLRRLAGEDTVLVPPDLWSAYRAPLESAGLVAPRPLGAP